MKYTCSCNLCRQVYEYDLMDFDIDEMIIFHKSESADGSINTIIYLCDDCRGKIYHISGANQINKEIESFFDIMQGNQNGLQNVYNLFKKLTDEEFINNFNRKLMEFKDEFNKMEKRIYECENIIKKSLKKIGTINDLYVLSKVNPTIIKKLANVVNILNYEDDE